MSSWRGTERSGRFFVLKRSFTVSLSLLDVLFGSGWCCGFVCFGFVSVSALCLDIQSFAHLPHLQQLEIIWPTMPRARSAIATKKKPGTEVKPYMPKVPRLPHKATQKSRKCHA